MGGVCYCGFLGKKQRGNQVGKKRGVDGGDQRY